MPNYVILMKLTDTMAGQIETLPELMDEIGRAWQSLTDKPITSVLATLGEVDLVAVGEAEDDETAAYFALTVSNAGWARATTMKAYTSDDVSRIVASRPVPMMKIH
jgi:uncharacterized protein with GYD domain